MSANVTAPFGLLTVVPVLPPGALESRRNRVVGDDKTCMITVPEILLRLSEHTYNPQEFQRSVRCIKIRASDMRPDDVKDLLDNISAFSNLQDLWIDDLDMPKITLSDNLRGSFIMRRTKRRCHVFLGEQVTWVRLDREADLMTVPASLEYMDCTIHRDMWIPTMTNLEVVKARADEGHTLIFPQTTRKVIKCDLGSYLSVCFHGDLLMTSIAVGGDEEPPRRRLRLEASAEEKDPEDPEEDEAGGEAAPQTPP
jgi:hypothetical protein